MYKCSWTHWNNTAASDHDWDYTTMGYGGGCMASVTETNMTWYHWNDMLDECMYQLDRVKAAWKRWNMDAVTITSMELETTYVTHGMYKYAKSYGVQATDAVENALNDSMEETWLQWMVQLEDRLDFRKRLLYLQEDNREIEDTEPNLAYDEVTDTWLSWSRKALVCVEDVGTGKPRSTLVQKEDLFFSQDEAIKRRKAEIAAKKKEEERQQAEERKRQAEQRKKKEEEAKRADERAKVLLLSLLTDQQKNDVEKHNYFDVIAESGATYRINLSQAHQNVTKLNKHGVEVERLCAYLPGVPKHDTHVVQKLLLETDEKKYRAKANITVLRREPEQPAPVNQAVAG